MGKQKCTLCKCKLTDENRGLPIKYNCDYDSRYDGKKLDVEFCIACTDRIIEMFDGICRMPPLK